MMKKDVLVIHPFLFALFPALSIVADHVRFLSVNITILILAVVTLLVAGLTLYILQAVGVSYPKAGIIVSLSLLLFFSYGHLFYFVTNTLPGLEFRHRHLLVIWLVLALFLVVLAWAAGKRPALATSFLNIMGATLIVLSLVQITAYRVSTHNVWQPTREITGRNTTHTEEQPFPDIYYIILDTYPSDTTLREFYNFDNHDFSSWLQESGFYVAEESVSNYAVTVLSLASALNMDYIDNLSPGFGQDIKDWDYAAPKQMIENNTAMWFLKSRGYKFIFLGSGYGVTQGNRYADQDIRCGYIDETVGRIIQSTLLWPFADQLQLMANDDRRQRLCVFATLGEIASEPGPKFVFVHMLAPHQPFLFDADGNPVHAHHQPGQEETMAYYVNQLIFVNKKVMDTVEQLMVESDVAPIIILQGDTGPPYGFDVEQARKDPTDEMLQQSFRILNAYYLPHDGAQFLYSGISPVNTFRLIFNIYFDAHMPLLADESHHITGDTANYFFTNVTQNVKHR